MSVAGNEPVRCRDCGKPTPVTEWDVRVLSREAGRPQVIVCVDCLEADRPYQPTWHGGAA